MAAVSNDGDGLPLDKYGNNLPLSEEDEETKSTDLTQNQQDDSVAISNITPDKSTRCTDDTQYMFPTERTKRKLLPLLPNKAPKVIRVIKLQDPRPTKYFPTELLKIQQESACIHCQHTTCHDLIYGDYCGLQATEYAKKNKKCLDVLFESKFAQFYTSSLKFHRYLSTGVIDTTRQYDIPECMKRSSYRNFFAVFKIDKERLRMERVARSGLSYDIRKEYYTFDDDTDE